MNYCFVQIYVNLRTVNSQQKHICCIDSSLFVGADTAKSSMAICQELLPLYPKNDNVAISFLMKERFMSNVENYKNFEFGITVLAATVGCEAIGTIISKDKETGMLFKEKSRLTGYISFEIAYQAMLSNYKKLIDAFYLENREPVFVVDETVHFMD